jgi:hypothetical protein
LRKTRVINIGEMFSAWTVIAELPAKQYGASFHKIFLCRCECGKEKSIWRSSLINGTSNSCGCRFKEATRKRAKTLFTKHGYTKDPLYQYYRNMHGRCRNSESYTRKDIKVCDRWTGNSGFLNFKEDIGAGYQEGLTFDRIDPLDGYYPENCRWVDWSVQYLNKSPSPTKSHKRVGVYFDKYMNKWVGRLQFNGKLTMGKFDTEYEANEFRDSLEKMYLPNKLDNLLEVK